MGMYIFEFVVVTLVVILLALIVRKMSKGEIGNCKYDERQSIERGKGFRAGFFTMLIYFLLYGFFNEITGIVWCEEIIGMFIGICLGTLVFAVYCIMNDAYVSLNETTKKTYILFAVVGALNLVVGVRNIMDGTAIENGVLNDNCLNLICGVLFITLGIAFAIKAWKNRTE